MLFDSVLLQFRAFTKNVLWSGGTERAWGTLRNVRLLEVRHRIEALWCVCFSLLFLDFSPQTLSLDALFSLCLSAEADDSKPHFPF